MLIIAEGREVLFFGLKFNGTGSFSTINGKHIRVNTSHHNKTPTCKLISFGKISRQKDHSVPVFTTFYNCKKHNQFFGVLWKMQEQHHINATEPYIAMTQHDTLFAKECVILYSHNRQPAYGV